MIPQTQFDALLAEAGLAEYGGLYPQFSRYCGLLLDWNTRVNLTAIRDEEGVAVKHFIDSLLPLRQVRIPQGAALVDVGTGAGFPGVPIRLARPDLNLTLLDSLQKRLTFLEELCRRLDVPADLVHIRAEDAGRAPAFREGFDVAVSRAVAGLGTLAEYCLPLVRVGGMLLALKGSSGRAEARAGARAVALCGGEIEDILEAALPGGDPRTLIVVRKISRTSTRYPRASASIAKKPL